MNLIMAFNKANVFLWVLYAFVFMGCSDITVVGSDDVTMSIIIPNNVTQDRINCANSGVISLNTSVIKETSALYSTAAGFNDMPMALICEVKPPVYEGLALTATHMTVHGNFVYVAYKHDNKQCLGAVDIIDVADPAKPMLIESVIFQDINICSLSYNDGYLYLGGTKDSYSDNGKGPAVLIKMKLNEGYFSNYVDFLGVPGDVTADVVAQDGYFYTVSANDGAVSSFSIRDNSLKSTMKLDNLKTLSIHEGSLYVLQNGNLHVLAPITLVNKKNIATSVDLVESKRTIDFFDNKALVSEGVNGVGIYDLLSGAKISAIALPQIIDKTIDVSGMLSNGVSINNDHVLVADGVVGVVVYKMISNQVTNLETMGSLGLSGAANYIAVKDGYGFVIDEEGCLKILKFVGSDSGAKSLQLSKYTGGNVLNVNANENLSYGGSLGLIDLNIEGKLSWSGSLAVSEQLNLKPNGELSVKGSLQFGRPGKTLVVNSNSKLTVEGSLIVYGDLTLNSGAALEFVGSGSSIVVLGTLLKGNNVAVTGTFTDPKHVLK